MPKQRQDKAKEKNDNQYIPKKPHNNRFFHKIILSASSSMAGEHYPSKSSASTSTARPAALAAAWDCLLISL